MRLLWFAGLLCALLLNLTPRPGGAAAPQTSVPQHYFSVRIAPDIVDWYNQVALPGDIATVTLREVPWLNQVTVGHKMVLFTSVAVAEREVPDLVGRIDMIGYDLEHWPLTPRQEQADPVGSMRRMRVLAERYGLVVGVGPDRGFTSEWGAELAPYADQFTLQTQRLQGNETRFLDFVVPTLDELSAANPDLDIAVQLSTEGGLAQMNDRASLVAQDIEGFVVLYTPDTVSTMQAFIEGMR